MKSLITALAILSQGAFATEHVRDTYIKVGEAVASYLTNSPEGQTLVLGNGLDVDGLRATLEADRVKVSSDPLRDSDGLLVDALGESGVTTLNSGAWLTHFEKNRDVYFLVFHEMLRSAGVNDEEFAISKAIHPFPTEYRVATQLSSVVNLIDEENLAGVIDYSQITVGGTGCPHNKRGTFVEFDEENNRLEISTRRYSMHSAQGNFSRRACAFVIPVTAPAGKRIVFSQVDLSAILDLKADATAHLQFEAFVTGSNGPVTVRDYAGPRRGRTLLRKADSLTTACGAVTNLRLNTSGNVVSSERNSSLDVERITVDMKLESCE